MTAYWYQTEERAFAPGIGDGWPAVIKAPHTKNARLVRKSGDPAELLAALKAFVEGDESRFMPGYHQAIEAIAKFEAAQ